MDTFLQTFEIWIDVLWIQYQYRVYCCAKNKLKYHVLQKPKKNLW